MSLACHFRALATAAARWEQQQPRFLALALPRPPRPSHPRKRGQSSCPASVACLTGAAAVKERLCVVTLTIHGLAYFLMAKANAKAKASRTQGGAPEQQPSASSVTAAGGVSLPLPLPVPVPSPPAGAQKLSAGAIAGIVIAAVILIGVIVVVALVMSKQTYTVQRGDVKLEQNASALCTLGLCKTDATSLKALKQALPDLPVSVPSTATPRNALDTFDL